MATKKLNAAEVLRELAKIRQAIPFLPAEPARRADEGRWKGLQSAEDFEYAAIADAAGSLADELHEAIERVHAEATQKALEVYYAAEELARDPAHAELIPHVQRMREAYERDYGKPIPPKPKT